jgi:hypothetical protein
MLCICIQAELVTCRSAAEEAAMGAAAARAEWTEKLRAAAAAFEVMTSSNIILCHIKSYLIISYHIILYNTI